MDQNTKIALFKGRTIRRALHQNEWWFVITDVVASLTDSVNAGDYLKKLRKRDVSLGEAFKGEVQFVPPPPLGIEFETAGGPQLLQCWNTEGVFRLIQSIPSPKAEPFKRWLDVDFDVSLRNTTEGAAKRLHELFDSVASSILRTFVFAGALR